MHTRRCNKYYSLICTAGPAAPITAVIYKCFVGINNFFVKNHDTPPLKYIIFCYLINMDW